MQSELTQGRTNSLKVVLAIVVAATAAHMKGMKRYHSSPYHLTSVAKLTCTSLDALSPCVFNV